MPSAQQKDYSIFKQMPSGMLGTTARGESRAIKKVTYEKNKQHKAKADKKFKRAC